MEFAEWTCIFIKVDSHIADLILQEYGTLENLESVIPQCGCGARYTNPGAAEQAKLWSYASQDVNRMHLNRTSLALK